MFIVLRRRGVSALLFTSAIGRLPATMSALALVRIVLDGGGDYTLASTIGAVYVLGSTIGQPLLGRFIDRTGLKRLVLLCSAAISSGAFVSLALTAPRVPAAAILSAAIAGLATPPIEPTLRSLWPQLFEEGASRNSAYALDAAVQEVAFIAGPLLTAAGIFLFGANGNIVVMALIGIVGTAAYAGLPALRGSVTPEGKPSGSHGTPLGSGPFRRLLVAAGTAAVPVGALTVTATAFGEKYNSALGAWALALNAVGALGGALLSSRFPFKRAPSRIIRPLALTLAVLYLPTAAVAAPPALWLIFALFAGISLPPLLTQLFALTPLVVRPAHANEANAWVISLFSVGIALGTLVAGTVIDALGTTSGVVVAVSLTVAVAMLGASQASPRALTVEQAKT